MKSTSSRLAIVAACALMLSCSTSPHTDRIAAAPSYPKLKLEELRVLFQSDAPRALEAIASLLEDGGTARPAAGPTAAELLSLAAEAVAKVEKAYKSALESKAYAAALAGLDSLKALSLVKSLSTSMPPGSSMDEVAWREARSSILLDEAEDFHSKGLSAPALLLYLQALDAGRAASPAFSTSELALWAGRALEARDRRSLTIIDRELSSRSASLPSGAEDFLATRDTVAKMRSGVVTIRVDKGIRIEQGMGIPDRVLGTGFYIDRAGYVLTNYHVISSEVDPKYEGYSHMSIKPADAPEARIGAKVVGYDRLLDIALIKVDAVPDYVFSLSDGKDLLPGQKISAMGSPAGLENTVTSGIVSAVGRKILQTGDAIQVDASLNPGNSGGPLIDETGAAVGVVFAGMPQFQNLNFAIPAFWIIKILPDLFRGGELHRAWLGLSLAEKEASPAGEGIEVTYRHPSFAMGIDEGDRLLEIDGEKTSDIAGTQALLLRRVVDSLVLVSVSREGRDREELRCLGERPFSPFDSAIKLDRKDRLFAALFGMSLTPLPGNLFESANYSIAKIWPGSIADESGLSENDPISLRRFYVDPEQRAVFIQIYVKKRKAGFLESIIQIPASLETPNFI